MARLGLFVKVYVFRALQCIFTYLDIYCSAPTPARATFKRKVPSTFDKKPGNIGLLFYTPTSYTQPHKTSPHPILINFHGGGFTIGNAYDDARWAQAVTQTTDAVVISVDYRRAPECPFPIGIEDCVAAVLWIWEHASALNLDPSRTALSGFSAGGTFAYSVAIRLQEELELRKKNDLSSALVTGKLVGLTSFYPSTDWTMTREERDASNPNLIPVIPKSLFRVFEESYFFPARTRESMKDPLLSPAFASDEILKAALPDSTALIMCSGDQLLHEQVQFMERLRGLGKTVEDYTLPNTGHAWDKQPSFRKGNASRDAAYAMAIKSLQASWAVPNV
ncbi:hypothetical protein BP6252_01129 [Coleophoma cylindrospora]|uniref:Alpha/beta hydrolase fold-3 domain-containing protein n=1 Tax=Coleophoma cylindrospora TaxID=1849047 RepID=A0A3D8SS16_9HELO|nr:hypothetical protein BP6252_01129 [Coleophoma cylindrospora]